MFLKLYTRSIVEMDHIEIEDAHMAVGQTLIHEKNEYIIFEITHSIIGKQTITTVHCSEGTYLDRLKVLLSNDWIAESGI